MTILSPFRTNNQAKADLEGYNNNLRKQRSTPFLNKRSRITTRPTSAKDQPHTADVKGRQKMQNTASASITPAFRYPTQQSQQQNKAGTVPNTTKPKPVIRYKSKPKSWDIPG